MRKAAIAVVVSLASTVPVAASDLVLGFGTGVGSDGGSDSGFASVELHSDPLETYSWGTLSAFGVVAQDGANDSFVGLGVSARYDLKGPWFLEGSIAAGYYDAGDGGTDLGGNIQFRSLAGVGYQINPASSVSLALDHLSNGSLNARNPGQEGVSLRYRFSF